MKTGNREMFNKSYFLFHYLTHDTDEKIVMDDISRY